MFVLSRKLGEKIIIGDRTVIISVQECKKGRVVLGFEADPNISINREEHVLQKEAEKQRSEIVQPDNKKPRKRK